MTQVKAFKLTSHVRPFINQDGAVLLNVRTGKYYGLNALGARICSVLAERPVSEERIAASIASEYDLEPSTIAHDVSHFLRNLEMYRLVERSALTAEQ
jgi:hypothetical protein